MDRLVRDPEVLWRQAGGVLVAVRADRPEQPPVAVTGPGSAIWSALETPRGRAELDELALALTDQPPAEVQAALTELLDLLERHQLVRRVP
jgi:hypothetical protein